MRSDSVLDNASAKDAAVKMAMPTMNNRPASEEVGRPPAQEEEPTEGDPVCRHHPLQVRLGKMELLTDGGKGDVDNGQVDNGHEVRHRQECERTPAVWQGVIH